MEPELTVSYDDLKLEVAAFLGYNTTETSRSTDENAEIDRYITSGLRRFYSPPAEEGIEAGYEWSFLSPVTTLSTTADDQAQDLPVDHLRIIGDLYFEETENRRSVVQASEDKYQAAFSASEDTGPPQLCRVRHRVQGGMLGQRLEIAFWPVPDATYVLTYRYEATPQKLSSDNPYPLGGSRHAELLIESCLAVAEQKANDERGLHTEGFFRLLKAAIQQDRRQGAKNYGPMGGPDEPPPIPRHGDTGVSYDVTYKGVTH